MNNKLPIKGWTILSESETCARKAIDRSAEYEINHLQLSHRIVHKLKHVTDPSKAALVNRHTDYSHAKGIEEVVVWDHQLNWLGYYPDKFKTGPGGELDLDNPEFWEWFFQDYGALLDLVPGIDGVVLTFIETDARVEKQYSRQFPENHQKIALLINKLANFLIEKRGLRLYVRTFIYFPSELDTMLRSLALVENPEVVVMCKETPHDFILTHPDNCWVDKIPFKAIVEFDCAHEFNGQGVVASVFPELHNGRLRRYQSLPNVVGYTARLDRYDESLILDGPSEINLFGLKKTSSTSQADDQTVYDEFIKSCYGPEAITLIKQAMQHGSEIIESVYYTLGLPVNSHSRMNFGDAWSYTGLVSARWKEDSSVYIGHDVNRSFDCWKDIVNRLAPPEVKGGREYLAREVLWDRIDRGWIDTDERMTEEILRYVVVEKKYGIARARESMNLLDRARMLVPPSPLFERLYHTFARTLLSARLFCGAAAVYYGMRVCNRGSEFVTDELQSIIGESRVITQTAGKEILSYPEVGPAASYRWLDDVTAANGILRKAIERIRRSS